MYEHLILPGLCAWRGLTPKDLPGRCHDALNRLLRLMPLSSRALLRVLSANARRLRQPGYLCLDDCVVEKSFARKLPWAGWTYSFAKKRKVYGLHIVLLLWTSDDGEWRIPVAFRIWRPKRELRLLTALEISAVISSCVREGGAKGARGAALSSLMYAGGLFPGEVADLEIKDWRADKALLRVGSYDTFPGRPVPLGEDAAALLRRWLTWRGVSLRGTSTEHLFLAADNSDCVQDRPLRPPAIGAILNSWAEQARMRRFSYRDLRRPAAADMLAEGTRSSEVKRILGEPVPEFEPEVLASRSALAGPKLRAVRLGSEHIDYFNIIGCSDGRYVPSPTLREGEDSERLAPLAGQLENCTQTPCGKVAFGIVGERPQLVLVHGTPWSSFCWRLMAPKLADSHSVYACDLPGHGESEKAEGQDLRLAAQARTLAMLIGEWGIGDPAVVFGKLVVVDPVAKGSWLSPAGRHIKKHPQAYRSMPTELFRATLKARPEADTRRSTGALDLKPYLRHWSSREGRLAYVRMAGQLEEDHAAEIEQRLSSIGSPLLVLAGDKDASPTVTCAHHLYQSVAGAKLGRIRWSGPYLPEESPEELAHAISHFLA